MINITTRQEIRQLVKASVSKWTQPAGMINYIAQGENKTYIESAFILREHAAEHMGIISERKEFIAFAASVKGKMWITENGLDETKPRLAVGEK